MKKKILIKIISLILILSLTSCGGDKECTHEWAEATCKTPKTCVKCNATEGGVGDHVYTDATCENAQECKYCGVWYGLSLGHKYDPATCYKPKTCQRCGKQVGEVSHTYCDATCTDPIICENCGQQTGEPIGHSPVTVVVDPTCSLDGAYITSCTECDEILESGVIPKIGHGDLEYVYNGDGTIEKDGTATKSCPYCEYTDTKTLVGSSALISEVFAGKKISILGDSISTYENYTSGIAADTTNSNVRTNIVWNGYNPRNPLFGGSSVESTWWKRTVSSLGATMLVNNSNSGESTINAVYSGRCTELHDNTGENSGEKPDIIFIYLGTNDNLIAKGDPSRLTAAKIKSIGENLAYYPADLTEAYAMLLYRVKKAYPDAEIYCLTNLERSDHPIEWTHETSAVIREVAALFDGVYVADICTESEVTRDNPDYEKYMPKDSGGKSLHPGVEGMKEISRVLLKTIMENSRYVAEEFGQLMPGNDEQGNG